MNRDKVFIDTNIPIYAAGSPHSNKEPSIKILENISNGNIYGVTSVEVLQEILYRFQAINLLEKGIEIFDEFSNIVDEVLPINFNIVESAKSIILKTPVINTRDAVHAATIIYYNISYIASFDKHFKNIENIRYYKEFQ
ncbi:type II toxin-antitoxin system VapC family toxin [bacterium]|nr:type II toxin-antitoxin system VapC family toxin [bacterium]